MIAFRDLLRRLHDSGLEFVVVGGVAATLHGALEPTRDLDVCIRLSPESWAKIHAFLTALHPRWALTPDHRPIEASAAELAGFKNLYALTDLGRIDFLGEIPPLGNIDALVADEIPVEDFRVRILRIEDLVRVKEYVRRPKDLEVAAELRAILAKRRLK